MKKNALQPKIIFQDNWLLVLDKPTGLVVNRAESVKGETLQDWLAQNGDWPLAKDQRLRCGIVHRLDKETSGLILVAKTAEAMIKLQDQFKSRKVKKKYLALVHGKLYPSTGEIALPIARCRENRQRFGINAEGKKARTKYQLNQYWQSKEKEIFSYLELQPLTGRTHQIRVHLAFLGFPLVADLKYAGKRGKRDRFWCPRLFLHATSLGFVHPQTGEWVEFSSPLPADLKNAMLNKCAKKLLSSC